MKLTATQKQALPATYGIPKYDAYTMQQEANLWEGRPVNYTLDFESVTRELETALNIGLKDYGSGVACWVIPDILKAPNNSNKVAQYWQLYIRQVCGGYTSAQINKAWKSYTPDQQKYINQVLANDLEACFEYLSTEFN